MEIVVRGRNVEVPEHYRQHVEDKVGQLERFDTKLSRIDVEVSKEPNPRQAERAFDRACEDSFVANLDDRPLEQLGVSGDGVESVGVDEHGDVEPGEGKSTTVAMLCGLIRADRGQVFVGEGASRLALDAGAQLGSANLGDYELFSRGAGAQRAGDEISDECDGDHHWSRRDHGNSHCINKFLFGAIPLNVKLCRYNFL